MWTFTGGCYYSQGCERYVGACGACPLLGKSSEVDLSRRIWQRKRSAWRNLNLVVVAPSNWMKGCAERSSLLGEYPVVRIPYGIDTDLFQPQAQPEARRALGLPEQAHIVLFGASVADSDRRKGFDLQRAALAKLPAQIEGRPVMAVVFGNTEKVELAGMSIRLVGLGPIRADSRLCTIYSAADVFAAPSREDNLPNTVIESLACGTPCVAFRIGGMADLITMGRTGSLATPFDTSEFATALSAELLGGDKEARRAQCRQFVLENFTLARQAKDYTRLYEKVLSVAPSQPNHRL
jgi:glycosyltransferase involved in cell wall biosynthesis